MVTLIACTALALLASSGANVVVLVGRRAQVGRRDRLGQESEERVRPLALALLDGGSIDVGRFPPADSRALARLLARFGRELSGASQDNLASHFERHGDIERELRALSSRRAWRRASAAYVLGDMGSQRAVETLIAALADPRRQVRTAAARSLGRLGSTAAVEDLVEALVKGTVPRAINGQALLSIGPAALPTMRGLTRHPESNVRAVAVELVGLLGAAADGALLVSSLRDTAADVRSLAAAALGRLGTGEAAAALRRTLSDRVPYVRASAAQALGALGDTQAVERLLAQARVDDFEPAQAAARALLRIDPLALAAAAERPDSGPHVLEANDLSAAGVA